jgi:hypothetical protein
MNARRLVEAAIRRIDPAPTPERLVALRTTLSALVPSAVRRVIESALLSGDRRRLESLRQTYTVTASGGEADISSLLDATNGLHPDLLGEAEITDASTGKRFEWEPDRAALSIMARSGFPCVAREGSTLVFSDADGALGTFSSDVDIRGYGVGYANGVIDIAETLEPAVLDALVGIATGAKAEEAA